MIVNLILRFETIKYVWKNYYLLFIFTFTILKKFCLKILKWIIFYTFQIFQKSSEIIVCVLSLSF